MRIVRLLFSVLPVFCSFLAIGQFPNFTNSVVSNGWNEIEGFVWDQTGQQYVWEKGGKVWVVDTNGTKLPVPLLDISDEVGNWRDHGLNGFALDPDFRTNGYFYLFYTVDRHHLLYYGTPLYNPATNNYFQATIARVTRYTADSTTNFTTTVPGSRFILIGETKKTGIPIVFESHSGGSLIFGTDKSLLVSTGDGGSYTFVDGGSGSTYWSQAINDSIIRPKENVGAFRAQMVDCLNGKILRIDPLTGDGLDSNPFYDLSAPRAPRSRVWALGLRNPFRMTLRPGTGEADITAGNPGTLYIGDVGWDNWEDLNVANRPALNFGWPLYEGLTPQAGYQNLNVQNQDAPNPLAGSPGCNYSFFRFKDLLVNDTPVPDPFFANPCDQLQEIPDSVFTFKHTRPIVDWKHGYQARTGIFNGNQAAEININDPLSPVQGTMFGGYASIAGCWYNDNRFPVIWQNTYFHADYVGQWIRNFEIDTLDVPSKVNGFWDNNGIIVHLAVNPVNGCIAYANYPDEIKQICYTGVINNLPLAKIITDTTYGSGPLQVQFDGLLSSDPENLPLQYDWDFGDGFTSTLANPQHTYSQGTGLPTSYYAKLTVTDDIGQTDVDSVLISVNNTPPQVAITSFNDGDLYSMSGFTNLPLVAQVTDAEHGPNELFYKWTTYLHHNSHLHPEAIDTNKTTSTVISPVGCSANNTYYFEINLVVTDAGGLKTSVSSNLYAACDPPVAAFMLSDSTICPGDQIQFTDSSSNFPVQWEWEFPGGIPAFSTDQNPSVIYNVPGIYDVRLIASSFRGSDTLLLPGYIQVGSFPVVDLGNDTTVCGSLLLDAFNQGASYLWNDGSVNATFNASANGVYAVTVTDSSGCATTDSVQIEVLNIPLVNLGNDTITCGQQVVLDGGTGGQLWLWNTGDTTQFITAFSNGIYAVQVTDTAGCSATDSILVTIYDLPLVELGNDTSLCANSIQLNAGNVGSSWLWNTGDTTQVLNVTASGSYSVLVTNAQGCESVDTIQVSLFLPPVFSLGNDTAGCATSVLLNGPTGNFNYLWQDNSVASQFTAIASGIYVLTVTDTLTGCVATDSVTVTLFNPPVVTFQPTFNDTLCTTQPPFLLSGGSPSGGIYTVNGVLTTVCAPSVLGQGNFELVYTYMAPNGCEGSDTTSLLLVVCTGLEEESSHDTNILLHPIPASDFVAIEIEGNLVQQKEFRAALYNFSGMEIKAFTMPPGDRYILDVNDLSSGWYVLKVQGVGWVRMLVER